MAIALHNYDTEKITKLLNSNIDYYQKIEAYNKLRRYGDLTQVIFNNYNSKLAYTYLEAVKKRGNFWKITSSIKKYSTYTNNYNVFEFSKRHNKFSFTINKILNTNDKKISFTNKNFTISLEKTDINSLISLLYKQKFHKLTIKAGVNENVTESDYYYLNYKKHFISLNYNYLYTISFNTSFNRFTTFSNKFVLNKEKLQLNHYFKINSNIYNTEYFKYVNYSNVLNSYFELGDNINYGYENNYLKVFMPFASAGILYNSQTNFGYSFKAGLSRSIFRADSFSSFIKYYKNTITNEKEIEILISYIYFF
jgi:hypothetical protein